VEFQEKFDPGIKPDTVFGPMHFKSIYPNPIGEVAIFQEGIDAIYAICWEHTTNNREEVVINQTHMSGSIEERQRKEVERE